MNQFVSTYRRDYEWPYVRSMSIRVGPTYATDVKPPRKLCACGDKSLKAETPTLKCENALMGNTFEWSRLGPMGPLLDPKLFPAKPTPMPRIEAPKFDRQEEHMKELAEKYPYLYGILQCAPPNDVFLSVDDDRLKSTYQQHFGDPVTGPFKYRNSLLAAAGIDGSHLTTCPPTDPPTCVCPEKFDQEGMRRQEERKAESFEDNNSREKRKESEDTEEDTDTPLPVWKSEYQNVIAQTGEAIMRYRMHCRKQKESSPAKIDD